MAVKRTWRQRRRVRLKSEGFLPEELRVFGRFLGKRRSLLHFPMSRPYILRMRIARHEFVRYAMSKGWSFARYRRELAREYIKRGWVDKDGQPSVWAMFRHFYGLSIALGDYIPPVKKKKGNIKEQRRRYREKQRTAKLAGIEKPSGDRRVWISQLQQGIANELRKPMPNPKHIAQLQAQISNLQDALRKERR